MRAQITEELPHLRRYAHSITRDTDEAEDLVQDCVVRAMSREDQFREGTHLRRWLFTILRNINIDKHRRVASRSGPELEFSDLLHETHQPPRQDDHMALVEVQERLEELDPRDRRVLYLSVFAGLPQEHIAKRMGIAVGTVKSRLWRTRKALADA